MENSSEAKCTAHFDVDGGITNSSQLIRGLSAMMGDLAAGRITNGRSNAICNAAGKILTTVKLEQQYGSKNAEGKQTLELTSGAVGALGPGLGAAP